MKIIDLKKYGPIISDKDVGDEIHNLISDNLRSYDALIIDLKYIKSMATFCAKQIFGKLYISLGSTTFFKRLVLDNANNDLKTIIQIGIQDALDEIDAKD